MRKPKNFVPTKATSQILVGIYTHEGFLSQRQINEYYFPNVVSRWPEARMNLYFDHFLVKKHNASFVNGRYLAETLYTLDKAGLKYLRAIQCTTCECLNPNVTPLNHYWLCSSCQTENYPRNADEDVSNLLWKRKPRWTWLAHDLKLNDVRLAIETSAQIDGFSIEEWRSEYELSYEAKIKNRLDGFFILRRPSLTHQGREDELAIHLEIDNGQHPLDRLVNNKLKAMRSFIGKRQYRRFFGVDYGSCFVVTTSNRRLNNLKTKLEKAGGDGLFFITSFENVTAQSVLTEPIWQVVGSTEPISIQNLPLTTNKNHLNYPPNGQLTMMNFI